MKLLLICMMTSGFSAWAASSCPDPSPSMHGLIQQIEKLDYAKSEDRDCGSSYAAAAEEFSVHFGEKTKVRQTAEFAELVLLAAAVSPYDIDGSSATEVSRLISKNGALKKIYEKTLNSVENCKRQFLDTYVKARVCEIEYGKSHPHSGDQSLQDNPAATKACPSNFFDYGRCLKTQKNDHAELPVNEGAGVAICLSCARAAAETSLLHPHDFAGPIELLHDLKN